MARSVDDKELGERLRRARTSAGITQEVAADRFGVARTTLVSIEKGTRSLREDELLRLAELYNVTCNALLGFHSSQLELVPQFRRSAASTDTDIETASRLLEHLASAYVEIEQRLNVPLNWSYPPERPLRRSNLEMQADELALLLRNQLGLGLSPISDVVSVLENELRLRVFTRELPSRISGLFAFDERAGATILLNVNHPTTRRAWTIVHEVAHLLTRRTVTEVLLVDAAVRDHHERFADLFAAAFLMPAASLRDRFDLVCGPEARFTPRHLTLMAGQFYVSVEAMSRRLEQLELLPAGTFDSLRERGFSPTKVDGNLERQAEPRFTRFPLLLSEAYYRDLISEGQLVDLLALDRVAVRRMLDDVGGEHVMSQA